MQSTTNGQRDHQREKTKKRGGHERKKGRRTAYETAKKRLNSQMGKRREDYIKKIGGRLRALVVREETYTSCEGEKVKAGRHEI